MSKRLTKKQPPTEKSPTPTTRKRLSTKQSVSASPSANAARPEEEAITAAASKYDDILRKIFYDVKEGFGSIEKTWKAAKKQNSQITKAIVKDFIYQKASNKANKKRTQMEFLGSSRSTTNYSNRFGRNAKTNFRTL